MAYECSPFRGSEWAVGWGRLLQSARAFETHVITSEANYQALEQARTEQLLPQNVRFYTPAPDATLRAMERKQKLFDYNYAAYRHWQQLAYALAVQLHAVEGFAAVHQVNVCTFREPGYTWKLGIPFVWGPMGGSQNLPWRFLPMLPWKEAAKEFIRGAVNALSLRHKRRVRSAAAKAALVIGANSTNQQDFQQAWGRKVELLLEAGLTQVAEPNRARFAKRAAVTQAGSVQAPLKILWSGQLQTRKALPILLRALAALDADVTFELRVLGDGPMAAAWMAEARRLGLEGRVFFLGRLAFAEAVAQMKWAELFCFTSLRDTSGNVVLEALAAGVPVVCFDHQGAGDMVSAESGIKIEVTSPQQAVEDWTAAVALCARDGERLLQLSEGATQQARLFLWERNGDWMNAAYRRVAGVPNVGEAATAGDESIER